MERLSLRLLQDLSWLVEDFCKDCKLRGMTNESIRRYRLGLVIFAKFLLNKGVDQGSADANVLKGFLQHIQNERNMKHKTVENYFSALSAFYDYLAFEVLWAPIRFSLLGRGIWGVTRIGIMTLNESF